MASIIYRRVLFESQQEIQQLIDLQNAVYKERGLTFSCDSFMRWYLENPWGKVISYCAFDDDKMVGHQACIPIQMLINREKCLGVRCMAVVTHPDYRGKGLFVKLSELTFNRVREEGYSFILGFANANSYPIFMKHFPFVTIGKLNVKFVLGSNIELCDNKTFKVGWDVDSLKWRMSCCTANYKRKENIVIGRYARLVSTIMGIFEPNLLEGQRFVGKSRNGIFLYVGLGHRIKSPNMTVPKFIKHSPFNVIFWSFDASIPEITRDNVLFQLIDDDVV